MTRLRNHRSLFRWPRRIMAGLLIVLAISSESRCFAEDKPEAPPAPAPPNNQQRLLPGVLRGLFGPRGNGGRVRNPKPVTAGQMTDDSAANTTSRDPVESRAPRDMKVEQLLQTANDAVKQQNWKSAVDLFQRLLDQPEDSLHRMPGGKWQSVHTTANQMLGQLPEVTLAEYRSQYGGLAQQQLKNARISGQTADYVNVATRFFHTPAGYEAAYYLAVQHLDRSEFGLAARWFKELAGSPAPITRQDAWLAQASLALAKSGDLTGANSLMARLSNGPDTMVTLGASSVKASSWLSQAESESSVRVTALEDWTQFYGTAARVGTAVGGDALLASNWSIPLTSSHIVRNAVKWLLHDLQDQQRALVLASTPLVIDGKIVYRDLRGVRSVEIERGRTLWESVEGVSPERILGGLPSQQVDPQDAWRLQMNPVQNAAEYQGLSAEYSPLTSLMFRDGAYGLISSDGKQIFVIEDHGILSRNQPGQHWGWDGTAEPQDPFGLPWKTNRLVSYDLRTGRTLWSVGGAESRESFDLPLAGSYFYGTPAVDGEELFLVAGKADDIRLWSLDRRTGAPNWSQLVAYSDTKIDVDIARRWITSQVCVGNGIIVCPTTVGWLVAIDRMRQSVLWAHRYAPRSTSNHADREPGSQFLPQRELNAQWSPSAPVISDSYVVYTPQEEPVLICLNSVDGRPVWEKPKEHGLYLAGVYEQKVVVVGETSVVAYHLADGKNAWTVELDAGVRPSGRGVVVDDRFYLPLSSGELRSIALSNGKILTQTYVGPRQPPLGNLAMHHGKLVSLSPAGLTAFGQRDAVLAEIQSRLTDDPDDAWALLRSSEIQLLNHQFAEALPLLRRIKLDKLTSEERVRQHSALIECLSTLIHRDIQHRLDELEELGRLADSPAEQLQYHELSAERLLAEHKSLEAFEIFAKLADEAGDTFVIRTDDRHITVRRTVWLSGRMSEIWSSTPPSDRQEMDLRIGEIVNQASKRSADSCERVGVLFSFHPAAAEARKQYVEWLVEANDLCGARLVLQPLAESADKVVAAQATERLARLMIQSRLPADAVYYYRLLETQFADVVVQDDQNGMMIAARARETKGLDFDPGLRGVLWKDRPVRLEQSVINYTQVSQDVIDETPLPFFSRLSLESYQSEQRLAFESTSTGQVEWMMPLRSAVRANDEGYLTTTHIGHQLFFVNRGVLHAISPIEKRLLWCKPLEDHVDGNAQTRHSNRPPISAMTGPVRDESSQSLLLQKAYATGYLAVVQPNYLCVYGRRSLSVLDPRTGDELWKLEGLPTNAQVVGTSDTVFAIVPGRPDVLTYRALDGKPVEIVDASKLLNNALMTHGSSFLLFEQIGTNPLHALGIRRSKSSSQLRLYDPVTQTNRWQLDFKSGTVVSTLGQEEVIAAHADGQVERIDIATGQIMSLESISAKTIDSRGEKYLIADDDRIYLIVNSMDSGNRSYSESLAYLPVNGTIYAWSRQDNQMLWQKEVKQQFLIVDRFTAMPILLFVSRSERSRGRLSINNLNIEAIHKQSGQILLESKFPSVYSGFHALTINAEEPSIELRSYNVRMRIVQNDGTVAEIPSKSRLREK